MGANHKGRTPGSTNKDKTSFDYLYDRACRKHIIGNDADGKPLYFDIVDTIVGICAGTDTSEDWTKADRLTAAKMIIDKRFASKREHTGDIDGIPDRIVITYDDSQRAKPVLAPVSTMGTEG